MYRSSLTLAFCVLYSAAGAASDLSSVYVAPGGIYAPSANVYVRPGQTQRPYAEPGYGYRQPTYVDPAYRAPAAVYGDYEPPYDRQHGGLRCRLADLRGRSRFHRPGGWLCRRRIQKLDDTWRACYRFNLFHPARKKFRKNAPLRKGTAGLMDNCSMYHP